MSKRPLSAVDKQIVAQLSERYHDVYKRQRDEESGYLISTLGEVNLLNFSVEFYGNLYAPMTGRITMDEYGRLARELRCEKHELLRIYEDTIRFCLGTIVNEQDEATRTHTRLLDLNFCQLDNMACSVRKYSDLDDSFRATFNSGMLGEDIGELRWLVFPCYKDSQNQGFVTIIENPFTELDEDSKDDERIVKTCKIYHLKVTDEKKSYLDEKKITDRILHVMSRIEKAVSKPSIQFNCFHETTTVHFKELPSVPDYDKPIQFLHIINQFFGKDAKIEKTQEIFDGIEIEQIERMETLRQWLARQMKYAIIKNANKAVKHLMFKRLKIREQEEGDVKKELC